MRKEGFPFLLSDISGQNYNPDMFELIIVDDNFRILLLR